MTLPIKEPLRHRATLMVQMLFKRQQQYITRDEFVDLFWANDPDGGPDYAGKQIDVYLVGIRKALLPGWTIVTGYKSWALFPPGVELPAQRLTDLQRRICEIVKARPGIHMKMLAYLAECSPDSLAVTIVHLNKKLERKVPPECVRAKPFHGYKYLTLDEANSWCKYTKWSENETAYLRKHWMLGASASFIAKGLSRSLSSVLGKLFRLKLCRGRRNKKITLPVVAA